MGRGSESHQGCAIFYFIGFRWYQEQLFTVENGFSWPRAAGILCVNHYKQRYKLWNSLQPTPFLTHFEQYSNRTLYQRIMHWQRCSVSMHCCSESINKGIHWTLVLWLWCYYVTAWHCHAHCTMSCVSWMTSRQLMPIYLGRWED